MIPNPLRCCNCNDFGHTSHRCKCTAKCTQCGKDKHEGGCDRPKICTICNGSHASSAKDCPVWQKEKESQHIRVEKRISFPEARELVEAKMPSTLSHTLSFSDVVNRKNPVKSVVCHTEQTWVSWDTPVQTVRSVVCVSGGPGSVSTGTQAPSGKSGPASADARALCESALQVDKRSGSCGAGSNSSLRHTFKTQTKTSWQSFCSSPTSKTKPKTVWKAIRKIKGKKKSTSFSHSLKSQWKTYHRQEANCKSISLHHF